MGSDSDHFVLKPGIDSFIEPASVLHTNLQIGMLSFYVEVVSKNIKAYFADDSADLPRIVFDITLLSMFRLPKKVVYSMIR